MDSSGWRPRYSWGIIPDRLEKKVEEVIEYCLKYEEQIRKYLARPELFEKLIDMSAECDENMNGMISDNILCSKCDVLFCSKDSLELHFNSCQGPEIEMIPEKLQITVVDEFSCSKCDMDFELKRTLEAHYENCKIAILQPGEEHLDHTYSKSFSRFEINDMKIEVKVEKVEDFEANEQVEIDYITSKDFDHPFIKSETFRTKTDHNGSDPNAFLLCSMSSCI